MRVLTVLMACAAVAAAGEAELKMAASVAKMQAAIEKQRAAVAKQSGEPAGFFTTPWLSGPQLAAIPVDPQVKADCEPVSSEALRRMIVDASVKEGVNPMLVQAMVRRESAGHPCAVSAKGAQGLMQLMPDTQSDLGVRDPFDPAENISAGTRYIRQMLARYGGDLRLALAAYNAGPQRVDAARDVPPFPETQAYVSAILGALKKYEEPETADR